MSSIVMVLACVPPPVNEYTPQPARLAVSARSATTDHTLVKVILLYFAIERALRNTEVARSVLSLVVVLAQGSYDQLALLLFNGQRIVVFCFVANILDLLRLFVGMDFQQHRFRHVLVYLVFKSIEKLRVIFHDLAALALVVVDVEYELLQVDHVALHVEQYLVQQVALTNGILFRRR